MKRLGVFLTALLLCACSQAQVTQYKFKVVKDYPHDMAAYTQGLFFHNGTLYETTDMRLGSRDIVITGAELDYHRVLVTGKNFTSFSRIVLDGQTLNTLFVDPEHVIAAVQENGSPIGSPSEASSFESVVVAQVNSDGVELSRTEAFKLEE